MIKVSALILLALGLSVTAQANCGNDKPVGKGCSGTVSMPEPSAIPELLLCVAGLGFVALRQRKSIQNN
jgi:hypothetical protein